ncbi:MAG TPA: HIT domain-containing protein [Candidatus Saccharimonadales bacterium]|jgi:ATP adenylyltransferase|nr:HIT domain-containing protein [Candidatus Saccharimonadales bacterium]
MYHYRQTRKKYTSHPKPTSCPFCDHQQIKDRVVAETEHAFIVPNRVFYDLWEFRSVTDHLLVLPKRHVRSLGDLNDAEKLDIMNILGEYESKNYNVYARSVDSVQRSVPHQHTHLIKTTDRKPLGAFVLNKPYVVIKF